jgi:hypothetical protein
MHNQSGVRGHIVVMVHPVVFAPFVWSLPRHVPLTPPQDVAVEHRIDCLTWKDEFLTDNPLIVEMQIIIDFTLHFTCRAFFGRGRWTVPLGRFLF